VQYFDEDHKNWNKHADLRLFERIYRLILRNRANASVLDVGCGKGNFLRYLRKRDPRLLLAGIDMSPNEYCDGIEFLCGDFLSWKFNQKFDVVVSLQVIEHVSDPRMFVRRVLDLCSDSALVITNTINEQSVLYDAARLARSLRCIRAYERLYSRHHLNHFNISSLRRLMESMGLKTERHLRHRAPVSAMDIPAPNKFMELVFRAGVWGTFVVGDLTGRSTYQTTICRK